MISFEKVTNESSEKVLKESVKLLNKIGLDKRYVPCIDFAMDKLTIIGQGEAVANFQLTINPERLLEEIDIQANKEMELK